MTKKTAFIFPGQGSQFVGMGRALWEKHQDVKGIYRIASEVAGYDVAEVSFDGPASELDADVTAQVAVYVCNEAHRIAAGKTGLAPDAVTGYSLGFYSALVCAGSLGFVEGLEAVIAAGILAVESSADNPGTMGAVIGLNEAEVEAVCADASPAGSVWVSNVNAARQVLVSGTVAGVERAVALATARGALSAYRLGMGAAYHSPMMAGASDGFSAHVAKMGFARPSVPLYSYLDARPLAGPDEIAETVATQISRKVLWKDTVLALVSDGVGRFVEAGPGSALTRMVRWVDRGVEAVAMETILEEGDAASCGGR